MTEEDRFVWILAASSATLQLDLGKWLQSGVNSQQLSPTVDIIWIGIHEP